MLRAFLNVALCDSESRIVRRRYWFARRPLVAAVLAGSLLAGCAGSGGSASGAAAETVQTQAAQVNGVEYVIGPGDSLKIVVMRNPELSGDAPVRPDGKISVPLIKDIDAVGKTPNQLAHDIEVALQEFVRAPSVSVIVAQARSVFSQVKIVGQAVTPRALPYRSGMRVLDAIVEVGGLSQYAAGNRAQIIRSTNGVTSRIKVRLNDLMNSGDTSQNLLLQPGDILVIPEARF